MTFTTRPELSGTFGMVASTHWLASAAGMAVLERGGNAFDAAVAAGLRAAGRRAAPERPGRRGADAALDATGAAARGLRPGPGAGGGDDRALPRRWAWTSSRARARWRPACRARSTPGCCCCATTGRCELADVLALRDRLRRATASRCCRASRHDRARRGAVPRVADVGASCGCRGRAGAAAQPGARRHVRAARARGRRADARGADRRRPRRLVPRVRGRGDRRAVAGPVMDARGEPHAGCSPATTSPRWRRRRGAGRRSTSAAGRSARPGRGARGRCSCSSSRCSTGFDLGPIGLGAEHVHTVVECAKLAFADREAFYGDSRADVPLDALLSRRVRRRAARAGRRRGLAASCARAATGALPRRRGRAARRRARRASGEPTRGDTCHLDVADRYGNLVSATPSGGWLQSSPGDPGPRLLPRHAGADVLARGRPAELARAGGERPRTTLSPSLALRDGRDACWRSARPAATSRTSGRCSSSSPTPCFGLRPAGGDRRADVPHHALPELVLSRARPSRGSVEVEAPRRRRESPSCAARGHDVAGRRRRGRSAALSAVARAPDGMLRGAARTRAGCRATPSGANWA